MRACAFVYYLFWVVTADHGRGTSQPRTCEGQPASRPTKRLYTLGMGDAYRETSVSNSQCTARDWKASSRERRWAEGRRGRAVVTRRRARERGRGRKRRRIPVFVIRTRRDLVASAGVAMTSEHSETTVTMRDAWDSRWLSIER